MMVPLRNMFLLTVAMMLLVLYYVWASQGKDTARHYAHQESAFICHTSLELWFPFLRYYEPALGMKQFPRKTLAFLKHS